MSGVESPVGATSGARSESDELRGWLMLVASLTAGITYSAALNPPGGVWQADDSAKGYIAGRPVLLDKFPTQYRAFYYFNGTSFLTSLSIIVLSSTPSLYTRIERPHLNNLVALDILALSGAFLAGSYTAPNMFVYDVALALALLLCIVMSKFVGRLLRSRLAWGP